MRTKAAPQPSDALTSVYQPVVRGYLLAVGAYYCLIAAVHPFFEHGVMAVVLTSLAGSAAVCCLAARWMISRPGATYRQLEAAALVANGYLLANVVVHQMLEFDEHRQIYFAIMALGFAIVGPSRRVMYPTIALALGALLALGSKSAPGAAVENAFIGLAGCFGAISVSTLLRGAILRELAARLAAEVLNGQLSRELDRNSELSAKAQELMLRAEAANHAKTEFLVTISHELRTPLNGVLGMARAMANDALPKAQRSRLATIQTSGQALLGLINDVLDISKMEAGRLELSPSVFDLGAFTDNLRELYGGLAAEKGLAFSFEVDPLATGWRLGDEVRLRQVFANLLSNALKFTPSGGITVSVRQPADTLLVSISDTGVGIPAEAAPRLFERFSQADASTARRFGGTGLGLAICREILQLMGEDIAFTSVEGEGTCFTFQAPLPRAAAPEAAIVRPDTARSATGEAFRLLVADDNATNRLVLQTLLPQAGFACQAVDTGHAAVAEWEAGDWDAILMDVHMPEMDGLTATAQIRARERETGRPRTPIIAVTASVLRHEIDGYRAAGMDACVAKPIVLENLLSVLDAALSSPVDAASQPVRPRSTRKVAPVAGRPRRTRP
ncbi:MAG: ATP-binding protein [Phenylobacterium sp.]